MKFNCLYIFIAVIFSTLNLKAQQLEQYSMFMLNKQLINPATSGLKSDLRAKIIYRKQWVGAFDGLEPTTYMLSLSARPLAFENVGLGLNIFNDITGYMSKTGAEFNYSYSIDLPSTKSKLSLGFGLNFQQLNVNFTELIATDPDDFAIFSDQNNKVGADADIGAYLSNNNYYIGLSIGQLFNSKISFTSDTTGLVRLSRHYFIMMGYEYKLSKDLELRPNVLIKAVENAPIQYEAGVLFYYDKDYWLGLNYRSQDALSVLLGFKFLDNWGLGYAYDITVSKLNRLSNGAHEIFLSYRFADLNF